MLKSIGESTNIAKEKQTISMEKRQEIEVQNKIIVKESKEAKTALAEAQPALEAARLALSDLDKADITEIRLSFLKKNILCIFKIIIYFLFLKDHLQHHLNRYKLYVKLFP